MERSTKLVMAYTTISSCMHMALLQLQALISIGLLLASMSTTLVPGCSAEEAPSGYGIELIRVDATLGDDTKNSPASSSGTYSPVGVEYSHRLYLIKLKMSTLPEPFLGVLDTGSDLVWTTQVEGCKRSPSSTLTLVSCSDDPDNRVMCDDCASGICMFSRTFGIGRKTAIGYMGNDMLIPGKNVIFGCAISIDDHLMPKSAQGIVGLNRGDMSLVQQLNLINFSYCLSNQQSSRLWLGDGYNLDQLKAGPNGERLETTPLVQVEGIEDTSVFADKYYIQLEGISIGGNYKYQRLPEDSFNLKSKSDKNKGVMFVDSGKTRTQLEKPVFGKLKELIKDLELPDLESTTHKEKTCFRPQSQSKPPFTHSVLPPPPAPAPAHISDPRPAMVLHFANGAKITIPWANYTDEVADDSGTLFCLTILEGERSILGNMHQQNTYMLYNLTEGHEKLSFLPGVKCSDKLAMN